MKPSDTSMKRPLHEYLRPIAKKAIIEKVLKQFRSGNPPKKRGA